MASKSVRELAISVFGAVLTYVAFTLTEDSEPVLRWSIVGVLGLLSVVAAVLAARSTVQSRLAVADRVRAAGDIRTRGVSVPTSEDVRVGTRLRAKGNVSIEDVSVGRDSARERHDPDA